VGTEGIEPNRQPLCNYKASDLQSPAENSPQNYHIEAHYTGIEPANKAMDQAIIHYICMYGALSVLLYGVPNRIRTGVDRVKGGFPRPLEDRDI